LFKHTTSKENINKTQANATLHMHAHMHADWP